MKRVVIVEDQVILSDLLAEVIADRPFLELTATYGDGLKAQSELEREAPDIVLLDVGLPGMNGLEILRSVKKHHPETYVLIFTGQEDAHTIRRALKAGADGFIEKRSKLETLDAALEAAEGGNPYYSGAALKCINSLFTQKLVDSPLEMLTEREAQVLQLIAESHSTKEISEKLNISTGTVNTHRYHLMNKLQVHDTAGLTRAAIEYGLVESRK